MFNLLISVIITVCLVITFRLINTPNKPPIFGIYHRANKYYWFKFIFMFLVLTIRRWIVKIKRAYAVDSGKSGDGTIHIHEDDVALEEKYDFGNAPNGVDAVCFNGESNKGQAFFCALSRRANNCVDHVMGIQVNGEFYVIPSLPDIYLKQESDDFGEYKVRGLHIEKFSPMRTWKLKYNGVMKSKSNPEKTVKVDADLTWSAVWPHFNFDYELSPYGLAQDLARQEWTRDFFKNQKRFHQSHYEQIGTLEGPIAIDGIVQDVKMLCLRDHSFGKHRVWSNFHRYVFHVFYLDNGDCMVVGVVCQPLVMSHITVGYVCLQSNHEKVSPVSSCDFQLYQHGENQVMPKEYAFSFTAGCQTYTARVEFEDELVFYGGETRVVKFYEKWCKVDVNGVKGKAHVEWQYSNVQHSS